MNFPRMPEEGLGEGWGEVPYHPHLRALSPGTLRMEGSKAQPQDLASIQLRLSKGSHTPGRTLSLSSLLCLSCSTAYFSVNGN